MYSFQWSIIKSLSVSWSFTVDNHFNQIYPTIDIEPENIIYKPMNQNLIQYKVYLEKYEH